MNSIQRIVNDYRWYAFRLVFEAAAIGDKPEELWTEHIYRGDNNTALSLMIKKNDPTDVLILIVYVDDILVTGNNSSQVSSFTSYNSTFAIRDLGR